MTFLIGKVDEAKTLIRLKFDQSATVWYLTKEELEDLLLAIQEYFQKEGE